MRVDRPETIASAWDFAFKADRPVVLDVVVDPNVPLLPPHISLEQATHFAQSVLAGDAEALGFLRQTTREVVAGLRGPRRG
jgi:pyruvate dehydrogenase (quinone)